MPQPNRCRMTDDQEQFELPLEALIAHLADLMSGAGETLPEEIRDDLIGQTKHELMSRFGINTWEQN